MKRILIVLQKILFWGLPIYVFLLPWQTREIFQTYSTSFPLYGDLALYATDILFGGLLLVWLAWMTLEKRWAKFRDKAWSGVLAFLGILVAYAAASMAWSSVPQVSFFVWLRLLEAALLILMIVTVEQKRPVYFAALSGAGVVQSLLAVNQFFQQNVPANKWLGMAGQNASSLGVSVIEQDGLRWLRAYGSLPHPNILGGFLVLALLSAAILYLQAYQELAAEWNNRAWRVALPLAAYVLMFIGLLLTFSRDAWIGFGVGFIVFAIAVLVGNDGDARRAVAVALGKLVVVSVVILVALQWIVGPLWVGRVTATDRLTQQSASQRADYLAQAEQVMGPHFWRGLGIGAYPAAIMKEFPGQPVFAYQPVHNVWVLIVAELGLAGFALFGLWIWFGYGLVCAVISRSFSNISACGLAAGLVALGLMGYADHFWWSLPVGLLALAAWVGLACGSSIE